MSYAEEMKYKLHVYNKGKNTFDVEERSYLDLPLSKCPIRIKMFRAIMEHKSFSNLGSTTATAIRWEGDYYIVSMRVWLSDERKCHDVDIAVGRQGKVPFMFRSPYNADPTKEQIYSYRYDNRCKDGYKYELVDCDPKQRYHYCHDQSIATRLDQLQCINTRMSKCVRTVINPNTKRKNKLKASVSCVRVHPSTNVEYEIGSDWWDVNPTKDGEETTFFKEIIWTPLFKRAWYYRSGAIASESQEDKIQL